MSTLGETGLEEIRLDKWLWCARFFKSRSLATTAIRAGHVKLNGSAARASRSVRVSDRLDIYIKPYNYSLVICGLARTRLAAARAKQLYEETEESLERREELASQLKMAHMSGANTQKRPGKHDRKKIIRFTRGRD